MYSPFEPHERSDSRHRRRERVLRRRYEAALQAEVRRLARAHRTFTVPAPDVLGRVETALRGRGGESATAE